METSLVRDNRADSFSISQNRSAPVFFHLVLFVVWLVPGVVLAQDIEIGVAWAGKSGMTRRVARGLEETLKARAPNIRIEWRKELDDMVMLDRVVKRFQKEKKGMVVLRSSGARYLGKHPPSIPTFIGGCNHPVKLGVLKNMDAPEGNITGVTYAVSYQRQFETFTAVLPEIKSLLLLMEAGHPSVPIDRKETTSVCNKMKIAYTERICSSKAEALSAVGDLKESVSIIVIGNHGLIIDNAAGIVAKAGKTPVFSYTIEPVYDGAICGLTADDVKLGRMLGDSVIDVLVNGTAVSKVPVKVDPKPKLYVNIKTAENIGVLIPFSILSVAKVIR